MPKYIRTLTILFDTEIHQKEIPLFRGAVLNLLGDKANMLFHNHDGEKGFRYAYPLIQYKRLGGKAAIVCIEEGTDLIGMFLTEANGTLRIGDREAVCNTRRLTPVRMLVQTWNEPFRYHLTRWLPLNARNYQAYQQTEGMAERILLLENILKGNLLSMLKGLDIHLEQELLVKITDISEPYLVSNKGVRLMAFNADFTTNLSIPNNVGIGKNASIGFGVVHQERKERKENDDHK